MNTDSPFEGNVPDDGAEPPYEWLDEWLCEYVDGTMDPSLEAVFEKYVEANPKLKAHVERLQETRDLLCRCSLPKEPSSEVEAEVCREVEGDMLQSSASVSEALWNRPVAAVGFASSVIAALVIGFLAGAMVMGAVPPADRAGVAPPRLGAAETEAASVRDIQATSEAREVRPPSSPTPFVATDSVQTSSTLTPIGMP